MPVLTHEEVDAYMREQLRPLTEELARYKAAVEVARQKGEHYPMCGMPSREVMDDREAHQKWRAAKFDACATPEGRRAWWAEHCSCWKSQMEAALK
jgi:hypothetical protein